MASLLTAASLYRFDETCACVSPGYPELEDMSLTFLERSSPSPVQRSSGSAFTLHTSSSSSSYSKHNYPRAILSIDLTGESKQPATTHAVAREMTTCSSCKIGFTLGSLLALIDGSH